MKIIPHPLRFLRRFLTSSLCLLLYPAIADIAQAQVPTPTKTAQSAGSPTMFPASNFEDFSIPTYEYRPDWHDWTFAGGTGIAKNGSAFTNLNPNAPVGQYVAFVQGGNASGASNMRHMRTFSAGCWRLRFYAAQRKRSGSVDRQAIRVKVGGVTVLEEEAGGTNYEEMATRPFLVGSGGASMEVRIEGLNPHGGDNTTFIDYIRVEPVALWNDPGSWSPSGVPDSSDHVRIPAGVEVAMNGACEAATVNSAGELLAAPENSSLTARWVMVMGTGSAFEVGTARCPFLQDFTLELTGYAINENIMGAGSKFLMAMDDGFIELHGKPQVSWTQLGATAAAGASQITLKESVGWNVGDQIVIAPSGFNAREAERRTITALSNGNKTLTLNSPLSYRHFGAIRTFSRTSPATTWNVDMRAEVGLLSHNVKVQGAAGSETYGFGGHVMVMYSDSYPTSGVGRYSNVEFYRMGQKQRLGRYPVHWHMLGDQGASQFVRDCSIWHSYNRAITIHGTNGVSAEGNVAYDHIGHGIFLEDGSERFNTINYNLALGTIKPPPGEELIPTDNSHNQPQNRTPSTYWITNPNNTMIGNVAAGTVNQSLGGGTIGTGFWFAFPASPRGLSASDPRFSGLQPYKEPLGAFEGNVAHSNQSAFDVNDGINADDTLRTNFGWNPPAVPGEYYTYLDDFTCYANNIALYAGIGNDKIAYRNAMLADNRHALFFACPHTAFDSLVVSDSGSGLGLGGKRYAYRFYDGPGRLRDSHLVKFGNAWTHRIFDPVGGASTMHVNHLFTGLTYDGARPPVVFADRTVTHTPPAGKTQADWAQNPANPRTWTVAYDEDGSLAGAAGRSIVVNHPMTRTAGDVLVPNTGSQYAYRTAERFGHLRVRYQGVVGSFPTNLPDASITRSGGGHGVVNFLDDYKVSPFHQLPAILDDDVTYAYSFSGPNWPVSSKRMYVDLNDTDSGEISPIVQLNLGNRSGLNVSGAAARSSLSAVKNSSVTAYYYNSSTDKLYLRIVSSGGLDVVTISWSS